MMLVGAFVGGGIIGGTMLVADVLIVGGVYDVGGVGYVLLVVTLVGWYFGVAVVWGCYQWGCVGDMVGLLRHDYI
ncbi:hypothetical protein ACFOWX_13305 [Sphingorhabdus arenilitoris]|uniref:Transmembrane protein n=1 Tax=Sphingorhabdus arenilitoris TaxID=1490041 RepID=A0ABV8RM91_9SPHN|nr:hypothetical protein [Thermopolyspora flexuosa]